MEDKILLQSITLTEVWHHWDSGLRHLRGHRGSGSNIGKVMAKEEVNIRSLIHSMASAWDCRSLTVIRLGFLRLFLKQWRWGNKGWVLHQGTWCYEKNLLVLRRWERDADRSQVQFHMVPFWIHVIGFQSGRLLYQLCLDWDSGERKRSLSKFFRFKADVDVWKPEKSSWRIRVTLLWLYCVRYEWFPSIC